MSHANLPVHEITLGRVKAKIWQNITKDQNVWFKVTFSCLYKQGQAWQEASSFHREDLPLLELAAQRAYAWIWQQHESTNAPTP